MPEKLDDVQTRGAVGRSNALLRGEVLGGDPAQVATHVMSREPPWHSGLLTPSVYSPAEATMTVPSNIVDLLVEQAAQLGRIEGKLETLNELQASMGQLEGSMGEFGERIAAVESTLATNQFWILAAPALVGAVLVFARYLERRSEKSDPESRSGEPADRPPALRAVETQT